MTAKLAFLTSPEPNKYCITLQMKDGGEVRKFEISEQHLANIVVDGAHYLLRKSTLNCVSPTPTGRDTDHERSTSGA